MKQIISSWNTSTHESKLLIVLLLELTVTERAIAEQIIGFYVRLKATLITNNNTTYKTMTSARQV